MNVWLLRSLWYDHSYVEGIFSSEENARKYEAEMVKVYKEEQESSGCSLEEFTFIVEMFEIDPK